MKKMLAHESIIRHEMSCRTCRSVKEAGEKTVSAPDTAAEIRLRQTQNKIKRLD